MCPKTLSILSACGLLLFVCRFLPPVLALEENPKLELQKNCTKNSDCPGSNVFCNVRKQCECYYGFHPERLLNGGHVCRLFRCQEDMQCGRLYDSNSVCSSGQCLCPAGHMYSFRRRVCYPFKYILIEGCNSPTTASSPPCLRLTVRPQPDNCSQLETTLGHVACPDRLCGLQEDCQRYKSGPLCVLKDTNVGCTCDGNYRLSMPINDTCLFMLTPLKEACQYNDQCGSGAACLAGRCECIHGHAPYSEHSCSLVECSTDEPCLEHDANTICDKNTKRCVCAQHYSFDAQLQVCRASESGPRTTSGFWESTVHPTHPQLFFGLTLTAVLLALTGLVGYSLYTVRRVGVLNF